MHVNTQVKYSGLLKNLFKPKTKDDYKKLEELEKLMMEYIFIRFIEEMKDKDFEKLQRHDFKSLADFAGYFKKEIPDFDIKLNNYINEFLKDYVRGK